MKRLFIIFCIASALLSVNASASQTDELLTNDVKNKIENSFDSIDTDFDAFELIKKLSNGNFEIEYDSILDYIKNTIKNTIKESLSPFAKLLSVILLASLLHNFSTDKLNSSTINLLSNAIIVLSALSLYKNISDGIILTIGNITIFINSLLPVLFSFLATSGNGVSAGALSPVMMMTSSVLSTLIKTFFVSLTYINLAFGITGSVTGKKFIEDFSKQIFSFIKWSIGIILTIYVGVVSVIGITAPKVDQIVIKSAKFSVGSFIPYVGGVLSDTVELVLSCSDIVKNSIGIVGLIGIISVVIYPIISNALKVIILNILIAFVSPITESNASKSLRKISECISIMLTLIIAVSVMCFISITVIINIGSA